MPYTHAILARMRTARPHVTFEMRSLGFTEQADALISGQVDAAFLRPPLPPGLRTLQLTTDRRVVCVSTSGDDPETMMVSASAPTRISALIGMTPDPVTITSSRCTVENPPRENFTT